MYFEAEKRVLRKLVTKRNFFFKNTTEKEAKSYLKSKTDFQGLTRIEIENLEIILDKKLPNEFIHYLLEFGRNCGDLFSCGQDIEVEKFVDYQTWAQEIIKEDNVPNFLDHNTFVFSFHQGYVFNYFKKEGEQYKIYEYTEGKNESVMLFNSFSEMLSNHVEHLVKTNDESQTSNGYFLTVKNGRAQAEWPTQNSGVIPRVVDDVFTKEKTNLISWFQRKR